MRARYAFGVRVRLEPARDGIEVDPATIETTVYRDADEPGTEGWLFFRDTLWRGELSDADYGRRLVDEWIDAPVESVDFRALHTDEEYLDALKAEVAADLELFKADTVSEVLSKYLGSSIEVR